MARSAMPQTFPYPPPEPLLSSLQSFAVRAWNSGLLVGLLIALLLGELLRENRRPSRKRWLAVWGIVMLAGWAAWPAESLARGFVVATGVTGVFITALRLLRPACSVTGVPTGALWLLVALIALSLAPPEYSTRTPSNRSTCRNSLKQIGLGLHQYLTERDHFPALVSNEAMAPRSWRIDLLTQFERNDLRQQYDDAQSWESETNTRLATSRDFSLYRCPSNPNQADSRSRFYTAYVAPEGDRTFLSRSHPRYETQVTDGLSNAIAVVEACGLDIVWTEPRDAPLAKLPAGVNRDGDRPGRSDGLLSSYHPSGAQVLMGDGSVRYVSHEIDAQVLSGLLTINGGEPVTALDAK